MQLTALARLHELGPSREGLLDLIRRTTRPRFTDTSVDSFFVIEALIDVMLVSIG